MQEFLVIFLRFIHNENLLKTETKAVASSEEQFSRSTPKDDIFLKPCSQNLLLVGQVDTTCEAPHPGKTMPFPLKISEQELVKSPYTHQTETFQCIKKSQSSVAAYTSQVYGMQMTGLQELGL